MFLFVAAFKVGVKKTHELANSTDTHLVDGLIDRTIDHARKAVLDVSKTAHIVNLPQKMSRAAALMLADQLADDLEEAGTDAATMVGATPMPPSRTQVPTPQQQPEQSRPTPMVETLGQGPGFQDVLASLRPTAPKPEAKAKTKAKGKRPNSNQEAGPDQNPPSTDQNQTPTSDSNKKRRLVAGPYEK